jgi:hypothetical protein
LAQDLAGQVVQRAGQVRVRALTVPPAQRQQEGRLQDHIVNRPAGADRLPQDTTVQVVACPGFVNFWNGAAGLPKLVASTSGGLAAIHSDKSIVPFSKNKTRWHGSSPKHSSMWLWPLGKYQRPCRVRNGGVPTAHLRPSRLGCVAPK